MRNPIRTKEELLEALEITAMRHDNPRELKLLYKRLSKLALPSLSTGEYELKEVSRNEFVLTGGSSEVYRTKIKKWWFI